MSFNHDITITTISRSYKQQNLNQTVKCPKCDTEMEKDFFHAGDKGTSQIKN